MLKSKPEVFTVSYGWEWAKIVRVLRGKKLPARQYNYDTDGM
jgi:hypothetical protein